MKVATIFSGGLASAEWALKYANIPHEIVFACEIDKFARAMYEANHTATAFYKDVKEIRGAKYRDKIDLLIGGFPCQAFSIAGQRGGFEDTRGTLFFEYARLVKEIQPTRFIAENVKGLLSHDKGKTWKIIKQTFRDLNYHIAYKVLNAKDYGTPQNRERIFIVGFKHESDYHNFEFPPSQKLKIALKDVLESEVDKKYFLSEKRIKHLRTKKRSVVPGNYNTKIAPCILATYHKQPTDGFYINITRLNQIGFIGKNSQGYRVYNTKGVSTTIKAESGGFGGKTGLYNIEDKIRRLTPRECFRLMGDYEDRVQFGGLSDTRLYSCAGNGIDIRTLKAIIMQIVQPKVTSLFQIT